MPSATPPFDAMSALVSAEAEISRLRHIQNWHQQALCFANIGIYRWESATDRWFWSDEVYAIRGFPKDEKFANPADFYARVHPDDRVRLFAAEVDAKEGRARLDIEYRFILPDGSVRWHRERADRVLLSDGRNEILFGALFDITSQKQSELDLVRYRDHLEALVQDRTSALRIAKDAAESAHRAKNMFVANVSHELRTPLNGIMGMTCLAQTRAENPKQREHLDTALQCAQRLLVLVNDLITIADIEAERLLLESTAFRMKDIGQQIDEFFRPVAQAKGLELCIEQEQALAERTLYGDATKLLQVVHNLIDNAIKFSEQGRIVVRFRLDDESASLLRLYCSVKDQGIGIAEADRHRIFSLFEQGDNSATRRHGGTGLGLALCRKLVNMMGGEIGVVSGPGAGATFHFTVQLSPVGDQTSGDQVSASSITVSPTTT